MPFISRDLQKNAKKHIIPFLEDAAGAPGEDACKAPHSLMGVTEDGAQDSQKRNFPTGVLAAQRCVALCPGDLRPQHSYGMSPQSINSAPRFPEIKGVILILKQM